MRIEYRVWSDLSTALLSVVRFVLIIFLPGLFDFVRMHSANRLRPMLKVIVDIVLIERTMSFEEGRVPSDGPPEVLPC